MTDTTSNINATIRVVPVEQPWAWLAAGWRDMWRAPGISLTYGIVFSAISIALTAGLFVLGLSYLILPLVAGFLLIGPMMAVGLYETSRRLEANEPLRLKDALLVSIRSRSQTTQLAFVGIIIMVIMLVWVRAATLLFALFFSGSLPPFDILVSNLFFTWSGVGMLVVGSGVGAVLAIATYVTTVVSVPMLLARDVDAITAVFTSLQAVRQNLPTMILWAWLIVVLTGCGLVTLFLGLAITFPLVGHATWHAYRDLVAPS